MTVESPVLRPQEAADYLRVSLKTLRRIGVKRVVYGKRTFRYRKEDLDNWLKARAA